VMVTPVSASSCSTTDASSGNAAQAPSIEDPTAASANLAVRNTV
jgi:hypothetical protein